MKRIMKIVAIFFVLFIVVDKNVYASDENVNVSEIEVLRGEVGNIAEKTVLQIDNITTVEDVSSYSPNEGIMVADIIGEDDRAQVSDMILDIFPYSAIGYVRSTFADGYVARGTGFLFGPNDVATAGHCLFNEEHGDLESVEFYLGVNGSLAGATKYDGTNFTIPIEYTEDLNYRYDYGVFEIDENAGHTAGYFGWNTSVANNELVHLTGFPADKGLQLWLGFGNVGTIGDKTISYDVDSTPGQSGSPVYNSQTRQVKAIHIEGANIHNLGRKVDATLAAIFSDGRYN